MQRGITLQKNPEGLKTQSFGLIPKTITKNNNQRFQSKNVSRPHFSRPHSHSPVNANKALRTALFKVLPLRDFLLRKITHTGKTLRVLVEQRSGKQLPFNAINTAIRSVGAGNLDEKSRSSVCQTTTAVTGNNEAAVLGTRRCPTSTIEAKMCNTETSETSMVLTGSYM